MRSRWWGLFLLGFATACAQDTDPTGAQAGVRAASPGRLPALPEMAAVIPQVPATSEGGEPSAPELSDEDLSAAVRARGGLVIVGLKHPAQPKTRESRMFPALTRVTAMAGRQELVGMGAQVVRSYANLSAVVVRVDPSLIPELRRSRFVNYIEPVVNGFLGAASQTSQQDTSWSVKRVGAPALWNAGNRGQYVWVTILDGGLDSLHIYNLDGPGNNVYCLYVELTNNSCYSANGHGAHVGGIIAARDNAIGYVGAAHDPAMFASVNVCLDVQQPGQYACPADATATGLDWAISMGQSRHIVNMSLGYCQDIQILREAVVRAAQAGILMVSAAGNTNHCNQFPNFFVPEGQTTWPGRYPEVISVSGVMEGDAFATPELATQVCGPSGGSRYGPQVELTAPFRASSLWSGGSYQAECGTSMAAPHVAAVAALVWTHDPGLSAAQVRLRLRQGVDLGPVGWDDHFGHALVYAPYAIAPPPPPLYTATISGPTEVRPGATCLLTATTNLPNPPHSHEWRVNDVVQPTTESFFYFSSQTSGSFVISVTISNGTHIAWDDHQIEASPGAPECLDMLRHP